MPREYDDDDDDRPRRKRSSGGGVDAVIPYKNGMALASYYCGVFGFIACIIALGVFGIVPIILGILGLMKSSKDPEARGTAHAWVGIICGAIQVLSGCALIGFVIMGAMTPRR